MTATTQPTAPMAESPSFRWMQLAMGIVCMAMIANLQYGWTLFVDPIDAKYHWGRAAIQLAFTLFVVTETWLVPIEAWFVDKYGPRLVIMFGGVMIALAWMLQLLCRHAGAALCRRDRRRHRRRRGVRHLCRQRAEMVSRPPRPCRRRHRCRLRRGCCDHRGADREHDRLERLSARVLLSSASGRALIVFVLAFFLRPPSVAMPAKKKQLNLPQTKIDFTPPQVLRTPIFWIMYLVFVMVASGGLMAAAQIAPIAHDFKIANEPVSMLGFQMAALTFAISLDRIFDGFGRPFFGWVSDNIGRENTMFIAFGTARADAADAVGLWPHPDRVRAGDRGLFRRVRRDLLACSRRPCGDTFGAKFATTNNGMLYTAKGTASLLVPLASIVSARYGWQAVFVIAVALNATAALMAMFVIKPLRRAFILGNETVDGGSRRTGRQGCLITLHSHAEEARFSCASFLRDRLACRYNGRIRPISRHSALSPNHLPLLKRQCYCRLLLSCPESCS